MNVDKQFEQQDFMNKLSETNNVIRNNHIRLLSDTDKLREKIDINNKL